MKLKCIVGLLLVMVLASSAHARVKADYVFTDLTGEIYTPEILEGRPVVIYIGSTF